MKIEKLKEEIKQVSDPRSRYGNLSHKLEDIVIIGLCTIICIGEDFIDMEDFGKERQEWLSGFLELPNGIPDSDTFRRVFEKVRPNELSKALNNWLDIEQKKRSVIAVDGKSIRGSKNAEHKAYHIVSTWVAENQITLGEIAVDEITSLTNVNEFAYAVRKHWSIESQLHWCLDVIFREDDARVQNGNSPLNMNVLRKVALSLLKTPNWGRIGLKKKIFIAALNPNRLLEVLFAQK